MKSNFSQTSRECRDGLVPTYPPVQRVTAETPGSLPSPRVNSHPYPHAKQRQSWGQRVPDGRDSGVVVQPPPCDGEMLQGHKGKESLQAEMGATWLVSSGWCPPCSKLARWAKSKTWAGAPHPGHTGPSLPSLPQSGLLACLHATAPSWPLSPLAFCTTPPL